MSRKTKTADGPDMRRGAFLCLGIFVLFRKGKGERYAVLFSAS